jgi:hypothetical protein
MAIIFNHAHHGGTGKPGHQPHVGWHVPPPHPILGGFGPAPGPGHHGGPIFTPPRAHSHPPPEGIHPLGPGRDSGGYDSMSSTTAKVSAAGAVS